jgi:hypothetical protein
MRGHGPPNTKSVEELARFWDSHDLTDVEQFLEEVDRPVFVRAKGASLTIELPPRKARRVKRISRSTVLGWRESSAKESKKWTSKKS